MATVKPLLSYADLVALPDDGKRYELLEGELAVSPAPARRHQRTVLALGRLLARAEDAGWGEAYIAPFDVVFDQQNVAEPDAFFVRRERLHIVGEQNVQGAPDLVVEVLSPGSQARDLRVKLQLYARFGVPYYWIVDPEAKTVRRYELGEDGYRTGPLLQAGQALGCPLFPGVTSDVDQLFG